MRKCGIFMNVLSLPSAFGIGGFGSEVSNFADKLASTGVRIWQILPITAIGQGNSPYSGQSAFAGNYLYIDPTELFYKGWIDEKCYNDAKYTGSAYTVDYDFASKSKTSIIRSAVSNLALFRRELEEFIALNDEWLADYALFMAIKEANCGAPWWQWQTELAERDGVALAAFCHDHRTLIEYYYVEQFVFDQQWAQAKGDVNMRGIEVMGDMPIYVSHDSADVWANREIFLLGEDNQPSQIAGVPPDYFSTTGQLWGNPIYNYTAMKADDYSWFSRRMRRMFHLYDICRFDHFRAVSEYWSVDNGMPNAISGRWVSGGGGYLLATLISSSSGEIVAEDLGIISQNVIDLRRAFQLKGMRVMQFGFDGDDSLHTPHNYEKDIVAYTGTHDNNTLFGWMYELTPEQRNNLCDYVGCERGLAGGVDSAQIWGCIRTVLTSVADYAIMPFQDLVGWGSDTRLNIPGIADGNWRIRVVEKDISTANWEKLRHLIAIAKRN